jgi:hypothetical protein
LEWLIGHDQQNTGYSATQRH